MFLCLCPNEVNRHSSSEVVFVLKSNTIIITIIIIIISSSSSSSAASLFLSSCFLALYGVPLGPLAILSLALLFKRKRAWKPQTCLKFTGSLKNARLETARAREQECKSEGLNFKHVWSFHVKTLRFYFYIKSRGWRSRVTPTEQLSLKKKTELLTLFAIHTFISIITALTHARALMTFTVFWTR